jgi:hypothetical protein
LRGPRHEGLAADEILTVKMAKAGGVVRIARGVRRNGDAHAARRGKGGLRGGKKITRNAWQIEAMLEPGGDSLVGVGQHLEK